MKKLLLGLLGGVSLGLLFAPEKGSKLRSKLAQSDNKLQDFGNAFVLAGKDASSEVKDLIESKDIQELISKGKVKAEDVLAKGKDLSIQGKMELKDLLGKAKNSACCGVDDLKKVAGKAKKSAEKVVGKAVDTVKNTVEEKKTGFSFFSKK